jgi:uncharacterized membrane protein YecN with MAPEG domain
MLGCGVIGMYLTALYAGLLAPLFIVLSARVIGRRRNAHVALGDGSDPLLLRRMRVQANFTEYVPFALVMLALAESSQAPAWLLHPMAALLLVGRYLHAYGVSQEHENMSLRVAGMACTLTSIGLLGATCLAVSVLRMTAI